MIRFINSLVKVYIRPFDLAPVAREDIFEKILKKSFHFFSWRVLTSQLIGNDGRTIL